jgi:hypothetical protein
LVAFSRAVLPKLERLLREWGLPDALVRAVVGSHVPLEGEQGSRLGRCVAVSGCVSAIWLHAADKHATPAAAQAALAWLAIPADAFQEVLTRMADAARAYADAFEVTLPNAKEMKSVLAQRKIRSSRSASARRSSRPARKPTRSDWRQRSARSKRTMRATR